MKTNRAALVAAFLALSAATSSYAGKETVTGTAVMSTSAGSAPDICKQNSGVSRSHTLNGLTSKQCENHDTCTQAKAQATNTLRTHLTNNGMAGCTKYMSSTAPCQKSC